MLKRILILSALTVIAAYVALPPAAQAATSQALFIYDEVNDQTKPYLDHFRKAFASFGIKFDEAAAAELGSIQLSRYDIVVIHGIVQAFNMKSPVRDWLKTKPPIAGKRVYLFVTANRWFLDDLYRDLNSLLEKNGVKPLDALSMATKDTDDAAEGETVRSFVGRIR